MNMKNSLASLTLLAIWRIIVSEGVSWFSRKKFIMLTAGPDDYSSSLKIRRDNPDEFLIFIFEKYWI